MVYSEQLFYSFCFSLHKIVDSEYSPENYKTLKINIGAIIKNPVMLNIVVDHLKTKKMCKNPAKKLLFIIRYVSDQYKTKEMCDNLFEKMVEC